MIAGFSRVKVPVETRASVSSVHSSSEPVHQWMRAGLVIAATSLTKSRMPWCVVGRARAGAGLGAGGWRPAWRSSVSSGDSRYVGLARHRCRRLVVHDPSEPGGPGPDATCVRSPDILDRSKRYGPGHTRSGGTFERVRAAWSGLVARGRSRSRAAPRPTTRRGPSPRRRPRGAPCRSTPRPAPGRRAGARPGARSGAATVHRWPPAPRVPLDPGPRVASRPGRPYAGTPDDRPGTAIQDAGDLAAPHGSGGLVGPGGVGNFLVTGHRTSSTRPFAALPSLRPGARVVVETRTHRLVYEITRTRWTSFRRPPRCARSRPPYPATRTARRPAR